MKLGVVTATTGSDYGHQLNLIKMHLSDDVVLLTEKDITSSSLQDLHIDVLVAAELPVDLCYFLRGLGVVTIVIGNRETYYNVVDIVIDYKHLDSSHYFTGPAVDFSVESADLFVEVSNLITKLEWDSQFFGLNVAYLSCLHLTENIYGAISRYAAENNIELIEYLCNCHDRRSVQVAEREGFTFVDIRLTFFKKLKDLKLVTCDDENEFVFRKAVEADINNLKMMARKIYTKSRYFFDKKFGENKAKEFYEGWIKKAVKGEFDDECWCLCDGNTIAAFCSIRYLENQNAQIGLLGVHETYAGKGVGRKILEQIIDFLVKKNISELVVVTQGRNYAAQNLYQSVGFRTKETQLWYHKWR